MERSAAGGSEIERQDGVRLVGLTGGIATGKTTAAKFFRQAGAQLVDADELARRVVEPGRPALSEIRRVFGDEVFRPDGGLDRDALGERVFADPKARARLNAILHPLIEQEARREIEAILECDPDSLVVYDVPLLFETGMENRFHLVAVVYAPRAEQERRLMRRNGLTREQARDRIASQMDIEEKARRAHVVLDNRGSIEDLRRQVEAFVRSVRGKNR